MKVARIRTSKGPIPVVFLRRGPEGIRRPVFTVCLRVKGTEPDGRERKMSSESNECGSSLTYSCSLLCFYRPGLLELLPSIVVSDKVGWQAQRPAIRGSRRRKINCSGRLAGVIIRADGAL